MFGLRLDEDIELALLEVHDAEELYALVDANREHLQRFLPWAREVTLERERAFIRDSLERFARGDGFSAAVRVDGVHAGELGMFNVRKEVGRAELGYWLAAPFEGRGIMTRAVAGLARVLFEERGFRRLEIRCDARNGRSRAVAVRLGFRHEGTLRQVYPAIDGPADLEVFGLMRAEWEQTQEARRRERGGQQEWSA